MKKIFNQREARIPFTKKGYEDLLKEKAKLLGERPEAVKNLREAREMGDLSENGYYKAARARLSLLDARIRNVERLVKLAEVKEITDKEIVEIGSQVMIANGEKQFEYTIVGSFESDPAKKTISHLSPLGQALIGKRVNEKTEVVTPVGVTIYTIVKIL